MVYIRRLREVKVVREVMRRVRRGRLKKWRMVREERSRIVFAEGCGSGVRGEGCKDGSSKNQIIEGP